MIILWLAIALVFLQVVRPRVLGRIGDPVVAALLTIYPLSQALLPGMDNPDSRGIWWLVAAALGQLAIELISQASKNFSPWRLRLKTLQTPVIAIALMKFPFPAYTWLPLLAAFVLILPVGFIALRRSGAKATITSLLLLWAAAFPLIDRNWLPGNGWAAGAGALALSSLRLLDNEHTGTIIQPVRQVFQLVALAIILAGAVPHFLQFR